MIAVWASLCATIDPETGAAPVSGLVAFAIATSICLIVLEELTRGRGRDDLATMTAAGGWLLVTFVGLEIEGDTLYAYGFRINFSMPRVIGVFLLAGTALVAWLWLSWHGRMARFDRLRSRLTTLALWGTAALTAIALIRCGRPPPDGFWASLPVIDTIGVGRTVELPNGRRLSLTPDNCNPVLFGLGDTVAAHGCRLGGIQSQCVMCRPLTIRHDAKSDFYFLFEERRDPEIAFKGTDTETRREVRIGDLAGALGPPIGWTVGAALGLVIGTALAARARFFERRREALAAEAEQHGPHVKDSGKDAARYACETEDFLSIRVARLRALAGTTCVLCSGPLVLGAALGRW